jgi:hypothetical protein
LDLPRVNESENAYCYLAVTTKRICLCEKYKGRQPINGDKIIPFYELYIYPMHWCDVREDEKSESISVFLFSTNVFCMVELRPNPKSLNGG